jgi:hypothetical protein
VFGHPQSAEAVADPRARRAHWLAGHDQWYDGQAIFTGSATLDEHDNPVITCECDTSRPVLHFDLSS